MAELTAKIDTLEPSMIESDEITDLNKLFKLLPKLEDFKIF